MKLFDTAPNPGVTFAPNGNVLPGKSILMRHGLPVWAGDLGRMPLLNDGDRVMVNTTDYAALQAAVAA